MDNYHLMYRSGIQGQPYFIFEYADNPGHGNRSYFFSSSALEGCYNLCSDNCPIENLLWFKQKILENNIPVGNILIHPDLLEVWNSC